MTYKILLACAAGMSTSILVDRIKEYAKQNDISVIIDAVPEGKVKKLIDEFDLLLLGPQVAHLEDTFKKELADKNVVIATVNMIDYGMMDAEKVLKTAITLIQEGKKQ